MHREKHQKIKTLIGAMLLIFIFCANKVWALPNDGTVVAGTSTITQSGSTSLNIIQTTDKSIINWQGYSIGANEKVQYFQPGSSSISLNRVTGVDPSLIYGQLSANGQVWVINPNGLLIGQNAKINVGSFLGSTLDINNNDFLNGNYKFSNSSGNLSSITNQGNINAAQGGYLAFISPSITNAGNITTSSGKTYFASGDEVTVNFAGNDLIGFTIDKATAEDALGIKNTGTIIANGGEVILSANIASGILKTVINNEGIIQAQTIENKNGVIKLLGGMENNAVNVGGTLDASAPAGGNGGFIETSAASVKVADNARVTTAAPMGSYGLWLIDPQDYTVSATGDIIGANLSTNLGTTSIELKSSGGGTAGSGNVNINDPVSWSANTTLTLTASNNVNVNSSITATGNTAGLVISPNTANGSETASGTGVYSLNSGAVITLSGTAPSLTIAGNAYTVINESNGGVTALQNMSSGLSGYYALGSNIDATATSTWNSNGSGGYYGFAPIGSNGTPFTGQFDGLNHTITNLYINRPSQDYVGLFGWIDSGSAVRNIGVVTGSVIGNNYVGGLAGENRGTISNAYTTGDVSGYAVIGGLVGGNDGGTISNAHAIGTVTLTGIPDQYHTPSVAGGLAGYNNGGSISDAYATGSVIGTSFSCVGGLVGENADYTVQNGDTIISSTVGTISNAYATGDVSGASFVGGLVGYNLGSTISNAYATGTVSGIGSNSSDVGGLVGFSSNHRYIDGKVIVFTSNSSITNAYATGNVSGDCGVTTTGFGGLVGYNGGTITNAYATGSVSGSANGISSQVYFPGFGGLVGINEQGIISNAYATGSVSVSIGGSVSSGIGGLVGYNHGDIANAYATGSVDVSISGSGASGFGGLVGLNYFAGAIVNAYATGSVSGSGSVAGGTSGFGGLVGLNYSYSSISNAYATGSVTGTATGTVSFGGLVGANDLYGIISNAYWNLATTGINSGIGIDNAMGTTHITGLTTAQMETMSSFAGWDIANTGGTSAVWRIYEGNTYPLLRSFLTPLTVNADNVSKTYDGLFWSGGPLSNVSYSDPGAPTSGHLWGTDAASAYGNVKNADTYTPTALWSDQQGYDISYVNGTLTITKAPLTITAQTNTKTYSATTTAAAVPVVTGLQGSDTVTGLIETYDNKNAGTVKTLSVAGYTVNDGNSGGNYTVTTVNDNTGVINQAPLIITARTNTRTYDTTTTAAAVPVVTGLLGSDTVTGLSETYDNKNAGTGKTLSVAGYTVNDGNSGGNYTVTAVNNTTGVINKASLTVYGLTAKSKTYDATVAATLGGTATITALGTDDVTIGGTASGTFADKNVGTGKAITVTGNTISGTDAGNYNLLQQTGLTANISKAGLTITAQTNTKTYDGTTAAAAVPVVTGLLGSDTVTGLSETYDNKNVGTGKALSVASYTVYDGNTGGNYTVTTVNNTAGVINKASLTVTANADSKIWDGIAYSGGNDLTYSAFAGGETSSVLTGTLTYSGNSQGAINVGSYAIIPGGLTSGNYNIDFVNGILTIIYPKVAILDMYRIMDTESITVIKNFNDTFPDAELFKARNADWTIE